MAAFPDWYCALCGGNVGSFLGLGKSCRCKDYDSPKEKKTKKPEKQCPAIPGERNQYGKRKQ